VKFAFRLVAGLLFLPILIVGGLLAFLVAGAAMVAMLVPLVPIALLVVVAWLLLRPARYSPV
jgi:hypothetical protein